MKKLLAKIIFACLSVFTISYILFYTTQGLNLSLSLVSRFLPGSLQYTSISGSWHSPITIKKLKYTDQNISFYSNKITLRIHLLDLIKKKVRLSTFTADHSALKIQKSENTPTNNPLDNLKLSWSFNCPKVSFRYLSIQYQKNKPAKIDHFHGHIVILNNRYDLNLKGKSSQHGHVNLIFQGTPNQYQFNSQWQQQQFAASLNGHGSTQNVFFDGKLKYQTHQAKLSGSYQFKTAIANLKSTYTNLNLQPFIPVLQAQISGSTVLKINLNNLNLNLSTQNHTKQNSIEFNIERQRNKWNAKWKIQAHQLKSINEIMTGDMTSTGSASINNNKINTSGSASTNQLSFQNIHSKKAQFYWKIKNNGNSTSTLNAHIGQLQLHDINLRNTKISLSGSRQQHLLSLQSIINQLPIILKSHGSLAQQQYQETLTYLHISPIGLQPLTIKHPSQILFTLKSLDIPNLCLMNKHNQLCISIKLNKNQRWSTHAKLNSIHITPWAKLLNLPFYSNSHINMQLQARGYNKKLLNTNVTGELSQGAIHINTNANQLIFPIKSVKFNVIHTDNNTKLNLQALLPQKNTLSTNIIFQPISSLNGILTTPLTGELKVNFPSLSAFPSITPWVKVMHGRLFSHFKLNGTLLKPSLTGSLNLTPTNLKLPIVGNTIEHIQAKIIGSYRHLKAKIILSNHNKQIICHTNTELSPPFNTKATLTANNFELINTPEYNIFISPNLNLNINQHRAVITGHIVIPKASIKPILTKGLVSIPEEDIIYSQGARPTNFLIQTHITATLGKKVSINTLGISGFLRGQLQISGIDIDHLTGNGTLHLYNGVIHSYSHVLNISPSSGLFFYNTPITHPLINLTATRIVNTVNTTNNTAIMTNKIMVGIKLHGKIHHPQLSLFSSPATLTQSEILSYLLLGNSSAITNNTMSQNLFSALTALELTETGIGGEHNEGITNKLISTFGFSEFGASSQSNTDALGNTLDDNDEPSFVVGRYFTKHLYVRYTRLNNLLQIKLILNPYWAIQASSSTLGNGVDLLYNIGS